MDSIKIQLSTAVFITAGILLFAGLPLLLSGIFSIWIAAKIFYGLGAVLFLFDK